MQYTLIDAFGAIVEYFAIYAFLWMFYKKNESRNILRGACHIIIPILFFLFSTYIENIYLRQSLYLLCGWIVAMGFEGNWLIRGFTVTLFQTLLILLEIAISILLIPLLGAFHLESNFYLIGNILVKSATFIVLIIFFFFSQKRKMIFTSLKTKDVILLLLFSSITLILVSYMEYLLLLLNQATLFLLGCVAILLSVFMNVALYYLFYQLSVGEHAKKQLQIINYHLAQQKKQQDYMDYDYREIRRLSHDMKRYLTIVLGLLEQNKIQDAIGVLKKQQLEIEERPFFHTGYTILDSILTYKFRMAQKQQIQIQLFWNLTEPIQIDLADFAVILSNGLDNAIEAGSKIQQGSPFITVLVENKKDFIKMQIRNNTEKDIVISNNKILTTKQNKKLHGLGLESMQFLAQKYGGEMFINHADHIVTVDIILKNQAV